MRESSSHNNESPRPFASFRNTFDVMFTFFAIHVAPVEAILLRRWGTAGEKYFASMPAAWAILYLLVFGAVLGDPIPLAWLLLVYLVALVVHRIHRARREALGIYPHSFYGGDSRFGADWRIARGKREPGLVLLLGVLALSISKALGCYLMVAAIGLLAIYQLQNARVMALRRARRDALIEQRVLYEEDP